MYLTKKIIETKLLMSGFDYTSLRQMTDREIMEYFWIVMEFKNKEQEDMS